MSRRTVRAAVAAFIAPPNVAGINEVFRAKPRRVDAADYRFAMPAGTNTGTIAYLTFGRIADERIEMLGSNATGIIRVYPVTVVLRCHSNQKASEDAQDDYDDMVDALKTRLRSDSYLGTASTSPNAIWFSSEGSLSSSIDLEDEADVPYPLQEGAGTLVIWGRVRIRVAEHL